MKQEEDNQAETATFSKTREVGWMLEELFSIQKMKRGEDE